MDNCWYHFNATVFTRVSARGAHLVLSSQRGALIRGRRSFEGGLLDISKRHQNTFNLSLKWKNSNNSRGIECLKFRTVCKTPLFAKKMALQTKLTVL